MQTHQWEDKDLLKDKFKNCLRMLIKIKISLSKKSNCTIFIASQQLNDSSFYQINYFTIKKLVDPIMKSMVLNPQNAQKYARQEADQRIQSDLFEEIKFYNNPKRKHKNTIQSNSFKTTFVSSKNGSRSLNKTCSQNFPRESSQKKKFKNTIYQIQSELKKPDNELLKKITIYSLKHNKNQFEGRIKSIESEFHYLIKKKNMQEKKQIMDERKFMKRKQMEQQKKCWFSSLQEEIEFKKKQNEKYQQGQKDKIYQHRSLKKQKVLQFQQSKKKMAQQVRCLQTEIHDKLSENSSLLYNQKKLQFIKQKEEEQERKSSIHRMLDQRKEESKNAFRTRWLSEFIKKQSSKAFYIKRSRELNTKIKAFFHSSIKKK